MAMPMLQLDSAPEYRVYKRRWFGLIQLVLLNIVVSWNWLSFSPVSGSSAAHYGVSETAINWLSILFMFANCVSSPGALWTLNRSGPKSAIIVASVLIFVGNWLRYAGTRTSGGIFGLVILGQIFTGLAQPFVLTAPTRYSDMWFTPRGRVSATALASLANPFGGALAQLIDPIWAEDAGDIPNMVLYIAIIATAASIPSFFIPARPPLPPAPSCGEKKLPLKSAASKVIHCLEFWLIFIPFAVYVGFFNSFSSLLNQILEPYGFSETAAGICGAVLIVVGLLVAAAISPVLDRRHDCWPYVVKTQVVVIALSYLLFIWAPGFGGRAAPYVLAAFLGGSSFSLLPIVLEWLAELTHPVSPEITSVVCWTGGQFLGAVFLLIMDALKEGPYSRPPFHLKRALVFEAVVALCVVPLPLSLGMFGRQLRNRRLEFDRRVREGNVDIS